MIDEPKSKVRKLQIEELGAFLKDKEKAKQLGSQILTAAIKNAAEEKAGLKLVNADATITINQGEYVPKQLAEVVKVDAIGKALHGWSQCWSRCDGVWGRGWGNSWREFDITDLTTIPFNEIEAKFTPSEINVLKENNLTKR